MFPIDLIAGLAEPLLGEAAKKILLKGGDKRRVFARHLLAFHDAVNAYRSECERLVTVLDDCRERNDHHEIDQFASSAARTASIGMAKAIGTMMGSVSEYLPRDLEQHFHGRVTPAARRRLRAIELFDDDLAALIGAAELIDMHVASAAEILSQQRVSSVSQKIVFWDWRKTRPAEIMPLVWAMIDLLPDPGANHSRNPERWDELAGVLRSMDIANDEEYQEFRQLLTLSVDTVDELSSLIVRFIRDNLSVEDFL